MKGEKMLKKLLTLLFAAVVGLSMVSTSAFAAGNVNKGQKLYLKKLKKACGMNGGEMAKKHTQAEWKAIYDAGKLNDEFLKFCPKAKPLKDKYLPHVYQFMYNYASDSGNVPSC